jgi:hypothetical protein
MTAVRPEASRQAVMEAALVLLEQMGLSPADLAAVPQNRKPVPTFADPVPGPRPAPELARYDQIHAERDGVPAPATEPASPGTALGVLAGVLDRDGQPLSATQTRQQALADADADHLAAVPRKHRRRTSHQARWLWRTLRAAELVGLDAGQVLADAIAERDLAGARDVPSVVDVRIRYRLVSLVPVPAGPWSAQVPRIADPEPATTTPPTRSGPNPPRRRRTFGPPGTRLLPASARPAGRTSAACPTAGFCICATPTLSKPPGHPGTLGSRRSSPSTGWSPPSSTTPALTAFPAPYPQPRPPPVDHCGEHTMTWCPMTRILAR